MLKVISAKGPCPATLFAVPQEKLARLDAALRALITDPLHHPYTHIAFTSKNGIYATLQRAAELCEDLQQ
eukprot:scaffold10819_cov17-Tisochrysis_lutea.AAC.1